jgi:hypothetical protein
VEEQMSENNEDFRGRSDAASAGAQRQDLAAGRITKVATTPALLQKTHVRFPTLQTKVRPPASYIYVDEALNKLGEQLCPTEWGVGAAWELHPFKYDGTDKEYVTCWLEETKNGFEFQVETLDTSLPKADLRACNRVYKKVRDALKNALEESHVRAFKLIQSSGRIDPINEDQRGLWTVMFNSIFYTGHAYENHNGESYNYRILIDRRRFDDWLASLDRNNSAANKSPPRARLERLALIFADHTKMHKYVPSKKQIRELLGDVLRQEGFELSGNRFQNEFWPKFDHPDARKAGRPTEQSNRLFERHKSNLAQIIRDAWRSMPTSQTTE